MRWAFVLVLLLSTGCATQRGGACSGWISLKGDSSAYGLILDGAGTVTMDEDGIVTSVEVTSGELTLCDRMGGQASEQFMGTLGKLLPMMVEAAARGASPAPAFWPQEAG